jgi:hypothetical protein
LKRTAQIIIIQILLCLSVQAQKRLLPADYIRWVNDTVNGLVKDTVVGDYRFTLMYRPAEMMLLKDTQSKTLRKADIKAMKKDYAGVLYFVLHITPLKNAVIPGLLPALQRKSIFDSEVNYFSFGMQQDVKLVERNDTLPCLSFTYERTFEYAPYYSFLLVFEDKNNKNIDKTFVYNDKLLGTGIVRLRFSGEKFQKIPKIKIKK